METKIKNNLTLLFFAILILFFLALSTSFANRYKPHACLHPTLHPMKPSSVYRRPMVIHHVRPPSILTDGFYVGVGAGYDTYQIRDVVGFGISSSATVVARGASGMLLGGYGRYFCNFYYGGELSVTGSGASSSFDIGAGTFSHQNDVNVRVSYAASLMVGGKVNPATLIYGRLGAVRTLLNTNETIALGGLRLSGEDNKWSDGLRFGLGIETSIFCPFSLRAEYTYTTYGTEGTDFGTQITTSQGQVMLGLIYHFDII